LTLMIVKPCASARRDYAGCGRRPRDAERDGVEVAVAIPRIDPDGGK